MIKKTIYFFTLVILICCSERAIAQVHEEGKLFTSPGIILGMRTSRFYDISNAVIGSIALDYALSNNISLGAVFGKSLFELENGRFDNSTYYYAGRVGFHMSESEVFDPYINLTLGIQTTSSTQMYGAYERNFSMLGINIGTRYMFTKNFGLYADVGLGTGSLSFGLVDRF